MPQTYTKMDPTEKAKWVAALRSGDYKQCTQVLYSPKSNSYCCLGVKLEVVNRLTRADGIYMPTFKELATLDWKRVVGIDYGAIGRLINMNDKEDQNFNQIADWIEANL